MVALVRDRGVIHGGTEGTRVPIFGMGRSGGEGKDGMVLLIFAAKVTPLVRDRG